MVGCATHTAPVLTVSFRFLSIRGYAWRMLMRVRFADCTLDIDARRLLRPAGEVSLSPKAFDVLRVLVEQRPRALSKAELLERVWADVCVSDASLARTVTEIRAAIGDHARAGHILRTVHGFGYSFVASAHEIDANAATVGVAGSTGCWLVGRHRAYMLQEGVHMVGRAPDVPVCLASTSVSRHHARVLVHGTQATIEDLRSKNGTFVRGVRLSEPAVLVPGDEIRIGPFTLTFAISPDPVSTRTATTSA